MTSRSIGQAKALLPHSLVGIFALVLVGMAWFTPAATAKDVSLLAIEIYDGPSGAAYVQLSDVLINGKAEMRDCNACQSPTVDHSAYNRLGKVTLAAGGVLERGADGVLRYSFNKGPAVVVVPVNVKFDHSAAYSLSQLADMAALKGTPAGSTGGTAPPIAKGVTLVFVNAPDIELAEYLRARRASDIPGWQDYLSKYPGSAHAADAKTALATLFVNAGEQAFSAYDKSAASASPAYDELKTAKAQSGQAHAVDSSIASLTELDGKIQKALAAIAKTGRDELDAYRAALTAHTAGYVHLQNARNYSDTLGGIDSQFPAFQSLQKDILQESNTLQAALRAAESARDQKQFDQALAAVAPYRSFAGEEPRIARLIDQNYDYHMTTAKQAGAVANWEGAIHEYEKAGEAKDTPEARDALKNARAQLVVTQDKLAVDKALASSKGYESSKDIIHAYEILANLPPTQRSQVSDDLERLQGDYVTAASNAAKQLRQAHNPIRGIADEVAIQNAYAYLQRAYELSQNESFHDRMDLLGNDLSVYFLEQAKRYLVKPGGSGTELGWMYLTEALPYKAENLDAVRDAMVAASAAHSIRSKLSIRVQFRDQTSQRDSEGFAGQLENAIITGLESSRIPVKVVRAGETTPVEPDFQLAGDVLQHHLTVNNVVEAMESKYRAGEKEMPSPDWTKANRDYEKATLDLQSAQAAVEAGTVKKVGKGQMEKLTGAAKTAQKAVEDAHAIVDSTPSTVTTDIIRPYTYTKKTVNIGGIVQLQFRVGDSFSGKMAELVPTTQEAHKQYVLLENVKQEDTQGVQETGTMPDTSDFLTTLETSALQSLVDAVRKRVEDLPRKIYSAANSLENESDLDGAGESYLRFLLIAPEDTSSERRHARQFLQTQFNMRPVSASTTTP